MVLGFVCSCALTALLCRYFRRHATRYDTAAPQRFHVGNTPRVGGLAMCAALLLATGAAPLIESTGVSLNSRLAWLNVLALIAVVLPAFSAGLLEDLTQRYSPNIRLLATAGSGALACWMLNLSIPRSDVAWVDSFWTVWPWCGIVMAFVAIAGLPHAFNIIDGYNGLAGTVAIAICLALAHVALQVGDRQIAAMVLCLAAVTLGFLVWNWPRGWIFAGDCGAYLWGVVIAVSAIMLVQRHPAVSPWFPMLLLIYPVWETLFSIYRKSVRGSSPGVADALHFHQLVFRRIVRKVFDDDESRRVLIRNNRTSPYLWGFTMLTVVPALLFWNRTALLICFCLLFIVSYVAAYLAIVRFKVPGWLRH